MNAELTLTALATLLACACVIIAARPCKSRNLTLAAILIASGMSGWLWSGQFRTTTKTDRSAPGEFRPVEIPKDGYLSSDSCRSCHPGEYDSWRSSYHRTMTGVASADTVKGDFHGRPVILAGRTYIPGSADGRFWIEMDDPNAPKDAMAPPRVRKDVVMTTGSHHMQVYWFASGETRILEQAPIVWWIDQGRWLPRGSSFLSPPGHEAPVPPGEWNQNCSRCHATHSQPEVATPREMYTTVGQFGIACEACHKPGEEHARLNRNPLQRYRSHLGETDETGSVVDPSRLDPDTASHACAQCHSFWVEPFHKLRDWLVSGDAFRPGDDLNRFRVLIASSDTNQAARLAAQHPDYRQERFWPDGVVRITGREFTGMMESPCFKTGDKKRRISCFSCHVMHPEHSDPAERARWTNDQLKHDPASDQDCLQCHPAIGEKPEAHTRHKPESPGSRCVNCHMPHTTYGLMTAIRSHQITSPEIHPGPGGRPNACNQCHLDKPLAWSAAHLRDWYGKTAPELSEPLRDTAASVVWMLQGDAVQRAITAWTLGWPVARQTSGSDWQPPHLVELMGDPYDVVRWIAWSSLKSLSPEYAALEFDFVAEQPERDAVRRKALEISSRRQDASVRPRPELLLDADNALQRDRVEEFIQRRDNTPITLQE